MLALTIVITTATPLTAQAGSLTIFNKNCTKTSNWATKKRITVYINSSKDNDGCTDTKVTVRKGHSKTIQIAATDIDGNSCGKYNHKAGGTIWGKYDIRGSKDSRVTCKKDWLGVCQCEKD